MEQLESVDLAMAERCMDRVVVQGKFSIHDIPTKTWRHYLTLRGYVLTGIDTSRTDVRVYVDAFVDNNVSAYRFDNAVNYLKLTAERVLEVSIGYKHTKDFSVTCSIRRNINGSAYSTIHVALKRPVS